MCLSPHVGCLVKNTLLGFTVYAARPRFCPPQSGKWTDGAIAADHCIIHGRATAPSSSHPYVSRTGRPLQELVHRGFGEEPRNSKTASKQIHHRQPQLIVVFRLSFNEGEE